MAEEDRIRWNGKFADRDARPSRPEAFLLRHLADFRSGTVLDLACGDGRNAIELAARGFAVTGADVSDVALERLARFTRERGVSVQTRRLDVDDLPAVLALGGFDNVIVNHFRPTLPLVHAIHRLLNSGGRFFLCAFNLEQHESRGMSERFCLRPGEFLGDHPGLEPLSYESFVDEDRHLDGYIFERR